MDLFAALLFYNLAVQGCELYLYMNKHANNLCKGGKRHSRCSLIPTWFQGHPGVVPFAVYINQAVGPLLALGNMFGTSKVPQTQIVSITNIPNFRQEVQAK